MSKSIVIIGTLDTKGAEIKFLKERIESRGHQVIVMDVGVMGEAPFHPSISREAVAEAAGATLSDLLTTRQLGRAVKIMGEGAAKIVKKLYDEGRLDGLISVGGAQGTSIGTTAMKALPIGIPKVMVSTIASGNMRPFIGSKDIMVMFSVTDFLGGPNLVSRSILSNAAGAIAGAVELGIKIEAPPETRVVGLTSFGTTNEAAVRSCEILKDKGYEVLAFHASGACGTAMEDLIDEGVVEAVLDISTHELVGELISEDIYPPVRPGRLTEACRRGIPQVVAPGGLDHIVMGAPSTLPEKFLSRKIHYHNPNITCIRLSIEEEVKLAELMSARLNHARGPTAVVIPLKGFSEIGREGGDTYDPKADQAFIEALRKELSPTVRLVEVDAHINDRILAETAVATLEDLIKKIRG